MISVPLWVSGSYMIKMLLWKSVLYCSVFLCASFYREHTNPGRKDLSINTENPQIETHSLKSVVFKWTTVLHVLAGDPVSMRMTACRRLQQSCILNLWAATPAPQRTEKVGARTDLHSLIYVVLINCPDWLNFLLPFLSPEPSYPKGDPNSTARRSWELRNFISQSKGKIVKFWCLLNKTYYQDCFFFY